MTRTMPPEPVVHPERNALLALQLGEAGESERRRVEAHVAACEECRAYVRVLADTVAALDGWADEEPPADGLDRVLAVVGGARPVAVLAPQGEWLRTALLSLAGVLTGALLIYVAGARVLAPSGAEAAHFGPFSALSGFGLAALVFFGAGSLVTLALAPMLILELQSRPQGAPAR
jgi:hypothetical protein